MATLTTGVVNAGFPVSGAPAVIKRGAVSYFSVVKKTTQLFNDVSLAGVPQTTFTTGTRTSVTYNLPVTFALEVGVTPYFSVVKNQSFAVETTEVTTVDVKTNPYYLADILKVNSSINETEVATTGFYHKIIPHTFTTESIAPVVNPNTNLTANAINSITIVAVSEDIISVMDNASFDQSLSTRQRVAQVTIAEPDIFALNVKDTYTNQNSPAQSVLNNVSSKIVEQNNNAGRINSSAIQPKGSEAGNIGFAQAFGNTTITGKWF